MNKIELCPAVGGNMNLRILRNGKATKEGWVEVNVKVLSKDGKKVRINLFAENNQTYNCLSIDDGYGFCANC